jgi:hypothetical protein
MAIESLILAKQMAEYAFRLEAVVKGYYQEHQAVGCTCKLCEQAELAWASIGHTGPSGHLMREQAEPE